VTQFLRKVEQHKANVEKYMVELGGWEYIDDLQKRSFQLK